MAYRTTYKTFSRCLIIALVYGKACIFLWNWNTKLGLAIKKLNMDLSRAGLKRFLDLNDMEELRNDAYINSKIVEREIERWHDQLISVRIFERDKRVLLYDSELHIFPGKLKSRRTTRQRASSAQVPSNSPSQAAEAPRIPHSEGGEATRHSLPAPQRRYKTRRPPTTLGTTTSRPESSVRCPPAKRVRTSGPGKSSRAFEPRADSELPFDLSPELIIRRLMVTAPPIDDNLDSLPRFTLAWRPGVLEARQITEALRIPFEPDDPSAFRQWSPVSQRDMVHILSRGTFTDSVLLRKKLPPGMLLIDVVLRCNLYPLQHSVQRRGPILDALFRISEGCCARSWSIWAFLLSLGSSAAAFVESDSLSTNGILLAGYSAPSGVPHMVAPPVPPQPEQGKLPAEIAPPVPTPEATSAAPPTTSTVLPVAPTTSESSITISASEFRALTAILRQIQQHLGLLPPPQPDLPVSSAPIAPAKDTTPVEVRIPPPQDEPPTITAMPGEASSPLEAPTI
ncbi:hypothetical protein CK203_094052 [Vitis vinifera]|uniref:Uncharacterized protein n=1 Tax=Vitis vinifera TaxID=29760 RepID=A0A438E191_VITVI|nr:hypothetical protein CK203_094052 [Vitis vinifera]